MQTSANNVTRTTVYDVFGQLVADYLGSSGSTLERENIYRGGQLLAVYETGANCYKSISQFVYDFFEGALGRAPGSSDPDWVAILTQAQAQGQGQLIAAAQNLGNSVFGSSEFTNHLPDTAANRGAFVTALYAAYLGRGPDGYGYDAWVAALNNGSSRDEVRHGFAYSAEFQNDVGQLCVTTSSTSASIKYVLSDLQGTTRAVINNSGSSSAVIARHDYLPFGEEIWAGSYRSSSYAYGKTDAIRSKYGLTDRDDATGLDHTWFRKLESFSARWTSPDPYNGSMVINDAQSFNRYAHVQNDPVNFVDPTGLQDDPPPPGGWPTDPSAYEHLYTWTWAPYYPGGSPGQGRHGMLLDTGDFAGGVVGGFGGGIRALRAIKQKICALVPSGRTSGVQLSMGAKAGPTGGVELVQNFRTGQTSGFAFGGGQVGVVGGFSGQVNTGFIWGRLDDTNSNYAGPFAAAGGSVGTFGGFVQSGGGLTVVGASAGLSMTSFTATAGVTKYTKPLQLGKWWYQILNDNAIDRPLILANQVCR